MAPETLTRDNKPPAMPPPTARVRRRTWLWGGAALAFTAGLVVATRRAGDQPPSLRDEALASWTVTTVEGAPLALSSFRGRGLVMNFWASWCVPCVREFPQLDRFARSMQAKGWRVLGVAVDRPDAVKAFLAKTPVSFDIGIGGFEALSWSKALGNVQGGLPFTAVFAPNGDLKKVIVGETTHDELVSVANRS